ncbi:breast carcinoma amplified sequence 2 [Serendipita vermifera]|nr:breast carcinoma amplified sequence 2 [Serendipita vermifera]
MSRQRPTFEALPYYDEDASNNPELLAKVKAELAKERKRLGQRVAADNDPRIPPQFPLFSKNPLLAAELERIESHNRLSAIDTKRFQLPPPAGDNPSVEDWQAALKNARAQLEHQRLRSANGALMQQYGANAWRVYNYRLEVVGKSLDKAIEELNERVTEVNRARKNEQIAIGKQLTALEKKWTELISSVLQIDIANAALEAEIASLGQRESELEQMLA